MFDQDSLAEPQVDVNMKLLPQTSPTTIVVQEVYSGSSLVFEDTGSISCVMTKVNTKFEMFISIKIRTVKQNLVDDRYLQVLHNIEE